MYYLDRPHIVIDEYFIAVPTDAANVDDAKKFAIVHLDEPSVYVSGFSADTARALAEDGSAFAGFCYPLIRGADRIADEYAREDNIEAERAAIALDL